jgi:hypothetical protein
MSAPLTRDAILALALKFEDVPVPEWGGAVRVQELDAARAQAIHNEADAAIKRAGTGNGVWLVACCVDAEGRPLFKPEDAPALIAKSARAVTRLILAINRVNGFSDPEAVAGN